jgi:hypothetical protein
MEDIVGINRIIPRLKKMIFKFMGGPFDGKLVVGESGKEKEAHRYYMLTDHGRVGQRFHTASEYAVELLSQERLQDERPYHFQRYVYEVVDRFDNGDVLIVLIQYVEQVTSNG